MGIEARCYEVGAESDPASVKNDLVRRHPKLLVQAVRAGTATNEFFVEMICAETLRAQASNVLLARKPEIDLLLRLTATTQISVAIAKAGARKGTSFLVIVAGESKALQALRVGEDWRRLARARLTKPELERVERAALLNAARG